MYLMRWPVFLLIWLKLIFSESEVAGNKATGQVTRERRSKPFQQNRGLKPVPGETLRSPELFEKCSILKFCPATQGGGHMPNPMFRRWTADDIAKLKNLARTPPLKT
jgi:hypothetical protein